MTLLILFFLVNWLISSFQLIPADNNLELLQAQRISRLFSLNADIFKLLDEHSEKNTRSKVLNSFSFLNCRIKLNETQRKKIDFNDFFQNVINLFNDPLPQDSYFNLSEVFLKYDDLNPKISHEILISWDFALTSLKETIENSPIYTNITRKSIAEQLNVPLKFIERLWFKPLKGLMTEFNTKIAISLKNINDLANILTIIRNNYNPLFMIELAPKGSKINDFNSEYLFSEHKDFGFIGYKVKLKKKAMRIEELSIKGTLKGNLILKIYDILAQRTLYHRIKVKINTEYQELEMKFEEIGLILDPNREFLLMIDYEGLGSFSGTKSLKKKWTLLKQIEVQPIIGEKSKEFLYKKTQQAYKIKLSLY